MFDPFIHRSRVIATKLACLWSAFACFTGSALPRIYYANTNTSESIANSFGRARRYWSGGNRSYNVYLLSHSSLLFASQGSGKTLAYGLPILHHILSHPRLPGTRRKLQALVLAPTRELALQVSDHLNVFSRAIGISEEAQNVDLKGKEQLETRTPVPPLVSIAAVVGGMSSQKQRRILERGVDVLVATPGRLWDTLEEVCDPYFTCFFKLRRNVLQDEELAKQISQLKFLVLDEADRMVEAGHYAEMDNILRLTIRNSQYVFLTF